MKIFTENKIIIAGYIGLLAAILVGLGEFLLHFPGQEDNGQYTYSFLLGISKQRLLTGHFIAVCAAPFYLVGFWHIYKMLEPAGGKLPAFTGLIGSYGLILGAVWLGSRGMIAAIVQMQANMLGVTDLLNSLINDYNIYSESLLKIVRATVLLMSASYMYLVFKGNTYYPKWMFLLSPFVLLLIIFATYFLMPSVGKYVIPNAMNVAYIIFFSASIIVAVKHKRRGKLTS